MGRRIEVELTSTRDDGSWTWRAAGARQPKGELTGTLLYEGAQVGDVVKVEAEFHVDGIEVTEVFAPKKKKERTNLLELKSRPLRDDELVTTQRVGRDERRGGRRRGGDRDPQRRGGEGRGGQRRERTPRPDSAEQRPKPKRLRPKRVHRDALLLEVGDEHRPIIEQVIKDGMPGVRAAIERQNAEAKAAGKPEIDASPIIAIAEKNLTKARLAEWRDRADAALAVVDELDLRDLRSVVVAGNDLARDDETRELAEKLKTSLDERVEADHANWLQDLETAIGDGRVVRALRLSSRPVKAGAPLPPELATRLAGQASEALAPDVGQERWATVLDALAFSPVRGAVTPVGLPAEPKKDLLDAVQRLADRIPTIATQFGLDPAKTPRSSRRRRGGRKDGQRDQAKPRPAPAEGPPPEASTPTDAKPATDATSPSDEQGPTADEAQTTESGPDDTPATDEPPTAQQAPTTDDTPTASEAQTTESGPDDTPATDEPPTAQQAPATDDTPTASEAPATDDTPTASEAPSAEAAGEAPITDEGRLAESGAAVAPEPDHGKEHSGA